MIRHKRINNDRAMFYATAPGTALTIIFRTEQSTD